MNPTAPGMLERIRERLARAIAPNASRPAEVAGAAERQRLRAIESENDLRWLLADQRGRRFLGDLIFDRAGVLRLSLHDSQVTTAANEGGRNLGLQLLRWIEDVDFAAALLIRSERWERAQADAIRVENARRERDDPAAPTPRAGDDMPTA